MSRSAASTVLFVSLPAPLGGSLRSLVDVLAALEGRCHRCVAAPPGSWFLDTALRRGLADDVVPIGGLDRPRAARLAVAAQLTAWAREHRGRLAAIHANGLPELNVAAPAAIAAGRPLVVWVHDGVLTRWSRRLAPVLARTPRTTLAAVSEAGRAMLRSAGVPDARLVVVANPIDPAQVVGRRVDRGSRVRIAYLGMASTLKGFDLLPAIAEGLRGQPVAIDAYAGPPDALPDVRARLALLRDPPVRVHPTTDDVRPVYGAADIVLCPSRVESFGRSAVEGMANGLPVVAADLPALREVIGDAGVFFPAGDGAAAADAVASLVHDGHRRAELGRRGAARARRFQLEPVVDRLVDLYGLPGR